MLDLKGFITRSLRITFMLSGAFAVIMVKQPPVVTVALGQDAVLPCEFQFTLDDKIEDTPVLYWQDESNTVLLDGAKQYAERAYRLDQNQNSLNKSIVLKQVQWADSQKYLCKISVTSNGNSSRKKGNFTKLIIYDSMTFDLSSHNQSLLRCEVNMTRGSDFILSVTHNGCKLPTIESNEKDDLEPKKIQLSQTVHLQNPGDGNYECELRVGTNLITKRVFHLPVSEFAEKKKNNSCSLASETGQFPEPWVLYTSLLLVQTLILLVLLIVTVKRRQT